METKGLWKEIAIVFSCYDIIRCAIMSYVQHSSVIIAKVPLERWNDAASPDRTADTPGISDLRPFGLVDLWTDTVHPSTGQVAVVGRATGRFIVGRTRWFSLAAVERANKEDRDSEPAGGRMMWPTDGRTADLIGWSVGAWWVARSHARYGSSNQPVATVDHHRSRPQLLAIRQRVAQDSFSDAAGSSSFNSDHSGSTTGWPAN